MLVYLLRMKMQLTHLLLVIHVIAGETSQLIAPFVFDSQFGTE